MWKYRRRNGGYAPARFEARVSKRPSDVVHWREEDWYWAQLNSLSNKTLQLFVDSGMRAHSNSEGPTNPVDRVTREVISPATTEQQPNHHLLSDWLHLHSDAAVWGLDIERCIIKTDIPLCLSLASHLITRRYRIARGTNGRGFHSFLSQSSTGSRQSVWELQQSQKEVNHQQILFSCMTAWHISHQWSARTAQVQDHLTPPSRAGPVLQAACLL